MMKIKATILFLIQEAALPIPVAAVKIGWDIRQKAELRLWTTIGSQENSHAQ